MCGILCGWFDPDVSCETVLAHRGPDSFKKSSIGGGLWMLHWRLSVVGGMSRACSQPMRRGQTVVAYNGELWNYRALRHRLQTHGVKFKSKTDTEVLVYGLDAYGHEFLHDADGAFSIVWNHNSDRDTIYCYRDPIGEVPLHIGRARTGFIVSSEQKGLLAAKCTEFMDAIPVVVYKIQICSVERITQRRPKYCSVMIEDITDMDHAVSLFGGAFKASVRKRFLTCDVKQCCLISGGVDSSAVAYELSQSIKGLDAFFVKGAHKAKDERAARVVAEELGLTLHVVEVVDPSVRDLRMIRNIIETDRSVDLNIGWLCYWLGKYISDHGFKVVYSGDASDEMWASYWAKRFKLRKGKMSALELKKHLLSRIPYRNFPRMNKIFMHHGVEVRTPFADDELFTIALRCADHLSTDGIGSRNRKGVLNATYKDVLPECTYRRHRIAFQNGCGVSYENT